MLPTTTQSTIASGAESGLGAQLARQQLDLLDDNRLEQTAPTGLPSGVGDPAEHVLAVGDLRVHRAAARERLARSRRSTR